MRSRICVVRPGSYFGALRRLQVQVDGVVIGDVKNNSEQEFSVSPGDHYVSVVMDWCRSPPVAVALSEEEMAIIDVEMPNLSAAMIGIFAWPNRLFGLTRRKAVNDGA